MSTTLALIAAHPFAAGGGWWLFLIPVVWFIVIAGLIVLATSLRRRAWRGGYGPWGHPGWSAAASSSAESTLADRYARGDIDEKEYRARLEVLRSARPAPPQP